MKKRLLKVLLVCLLFISYSPIDTYSEEETAQATNDLIVNEIDYKDIKELDLDLYSNGYLLIRLNDFKAMFGKNYNNKFYPASLTKVVTLNTVVKNVSDFTDTSSISSEDYEYLVSQNASLAGLSINKEYSIEDLLYALVLPSGADGAKALENYFAKKGKNLVEMMNENIKDLGLSDSHFTNTTGLHDDDLYTSLKDYADIIVDTLNYPKAKEVLKVFNYQLQDNSSVKSTLSALNDLDNVTIYGGKTGFTDEAGENIMILYSYKNRSYLLILANAPGNPYIENQKYHFSDVKTILEYLYK